MASSVDLALVSVEWALSVEQASFETSTKALGFLYGGCDALAWSTETILSQLVFSKIRCTHTKWKVHLIVPKAHYPYTYHMMRARVKWHG
jgi:hypothetical protein